MSENKKTMNNRSTPRKNRKRLSQFGKVLIISWIVILLIGGAIGAGITGICLSSKTNTDQDAVLPPYGTRDARFFGGEISMDWGSDYDFTPLDCALPEELQEFTFYLSKGYYIDFSFVMGLMYCESSFQTEIVSGTNDYGLMQINACNNEWLAEDLA